MTGIDIRLAAQLADAYSLIMVCFQLYSDHVIISDALAMQSLRQRQGAMTSSSFNVTSNIDELVHKFTIDDSIAECFASCEKIAKSGKFIKVRAIREDFSKRGKYNVF